MDCFVACAPLHKRFAFVAVNDEETPPIHGRTTMIYGDAGQKEGPPKRAFQNGSYQADRDQAVLV
jgi:hypothetical protein